MAVALCGWSGREAPARGTFRVARTQSKRRGRYGAGRVAAEYEGCGRDVSRHWRSAHGWLSLPLTIRHTVHRARTIATACSVLTGCSMATGVTVVCVPRLTVELVAHVCAGGLAVRLLSAIRERLPGRRLLLHVPV